MFLKNGMVKRIVVGKDFTEEDLERLLTYFEPKDIAKAEVAQYSVSIGIPAPYVQRKNVSNPVEIQFKKEKSKLELGRIVSKAYFEAYLNQEQFSEKLGEWDENHSFFSLYLGYPIN